MGKSASFTAAKLKWKLHYLAGKTRFELCQEFIVGYLWIRSHDSCSQAVFSRRKMWLGSPPPHVLGRSFPRKTALFSVVKTKTSGGKVPVTPPSPICTLAERTYVVQEARVVSFFGFFIYFKSLFFYYSPNVESDFFRCNFFWQENFFAEFFFRNFFPEKKLTNF